MTKEDILQSCKDQLKIHIDMILQQGVRPTWVEIELYHYMRKLLREERH